ncbi:unnamed protein product, partial [Tetraodon nigroviridis]
LSAGQQVGRFDNQFKVMCLGLHPSGPETFLCGGYSSVVKAWDSRCSKVVKLYKASIQQTLDILFLRGGVEFVTSSDCVSRDSADRTLIAWDFQTTAKLSNQIYHERYTCPSLALHPLEEAFVAQTNGDYMAVFSSQKPYKMNKRRRYEGHKVEGYAVQCEFSLDGSILASGSSCGPLISIITTMLVCCKPSTPTGKPACACPSIPSPPPPQPPATGLERSRSGTNHPK